MDYLPGKGGREELVMRQTVALQNLDCASCASKMERAVQNIPGVSSVRVNVLSQKLTLETGGAYDHEEVLEAAKRAMRKIERKLVFSE